MPRVHKPAPPPVDPILQTFRGDPKAAIALHPLEQAILVIVGVHLCFMPWALGTMHVWSQFISLGLAVAGLGVALVNRRYTAEFSHADAFTLIMWPKLVRFPIFWLGLALLGYIVIQALNPAWVYAVNGGVPWLVPLEHITWLPAGIEAPFQKMNAWRALMIYGSAWLLVCALWVGVTRRATLQHLLTIVVVNGTVLSIVGILQRGMGTKKLLWFVDTWPYFFSTFIYKNHAGAYFNLVFMISVALAYWHFTRAERRMQRSNPASFFAFCAVLLGIGVLLAHSKAAILLLIAFSAIAFMGFVVRYKSSNDGENRNFLTIGALGVIFILFIGLGTAQLGLNQSFDGVSKLIDKGSDDASVSGRMIAQKAAWDMAKDNLVTGWGAGGFRHMFPMYQRNYPEIYYTYRSPQVSRLLYWEYAHNDYIQLLDELGLIGAGLFLAMAVCTLRCLIKNRFYHRPHLLLVVLALAALLVHCWVDFQSHNPAILLLGCASAALACRWAELENRRV